MEEIDATAARRRWSCKLGAGGDRHWVRWRSALGGFPLQEIGVVCTWWGGDWCCLDSVRGRENRVSGYWGRVMGKKKKGCIRRYGAQAVCQVWVPQKVKIFEWWEAENNVPNVLGLGNWDILSDEWRKLSEEWWVMVFFKPNNLLDFLVSITHHSKMEGPTKMQFVWICFQVLFPSLNSYIFE